MKTNVFKLIIRSIAFLLIFCLLLTLATLVFLPKRNCEDSESAQVAGFYKEPDNTLDVLFLGSCNMYSSVSPVLIYEQYGITGYAMCCPDEEMSTSYYYLREALKHQDLKMVVVESLFLTETNTSRREHFNRYALDYIPLSLNKIALAWNISVRESAFMKKYDATAPDQLLTFAGYLFPLLRFHSRNDLSTEDLTDLFISGQYNFYKGGFPQYNYTSNDGLFWDKIFNGSRINDMAAQYVPMIKELCDEKGIPMIIIKSPNYSRWGYDDKQTKIVRDFAESLGVPFVDFHLPENNNFREWDYGYQTGRLNVFGVKKFSETLGRILSEDYGLQPTALSEKDKAAWDACVEKYYQVAEEKGCSITDGRIAQICNRDGAIRVRWNACDDCSTYSIYRCKGKDGTYKKLTDKAEGDYYLDEDVVNGQGYSYYVVPNEGALAGQKSQTAYYVYVDMPKDFQVENRNGKMRLSWEKVEGVKYYRIQRRRPNDFNFDTYTNKATGSYYVNDSNIKQGTVYYYRIAAKYEEDGVTYYSMTSVVRGMPQKTPVISSVSSSDSKAVINWTALENQDEIQIFRRSENEDSFKLIATVKGDKTRYTDKKVEVGVQYFYKIVSLRSAYGYDGVSDESNTVGVKVVK
ncbi:MAG: hypothetical protein IK149_07850 [Oscillospiraceae bacterium]|nr:hypothetical protein [Oscillospiraceae bacterium]